MKVLLSRWQFGVTITYHFLFVPLTIGLALLVAVMQVLAAVWLSAGGSHGPGGVGAAVPIGLAVGCGLAFAASGGLVLASRAGFAFGLSTLGIVAAVAAIFTALFPRVMVSSGPGPALTVWSAASAHQTLLVMTVIAIFVPFVLAYQGWSYWVFRQRLTRPAGQPGPSPGAGAPRPAAAPGLSQPGLSQPGLSQPGPSPHHGR